MKSKQSSAQPGDAESFVGELFADRYRITRIVSEGANTLVADAFDEETGRTVTLKLVRARLSAKPAIRDRFDKTMRGVAALSHPNIAAVYDWGFAPIGSATLAYVVVEQLSGGSLRDMLDRGRRLTPSQGLTVGLDACRALDYAHRQGFVHTELTPAKILFGDDRRLRIIDFGLSELLSAEAWDHLDSLPTDIAWYAAPEQGPGQPIDAKADVYSLALILHEAVTGTLPFKSDSTVATLAARQNKLMKVSADLGPLAAVLERSGRPEPQERSSAAEFGAGLVRTASKLPRPEPLPLLSTGMFDVPAEEMREPNDPTGGVRRSAPAEPPPVVVVPDAEAEVNDDGEADLHVDAKAATNVNVADEQSPPDLFADGSSKLEPLELDLSGESPLITSDTLAGAAPGQSDAVPAEAKKSTKKKAESVGKTAPTDEPAPDTTPDAAASDAPAAVDETDSTDDGDSERATAPGGPSGSTSEFEIEPLVPEVLEPPVIVEADPDLDLEQPIEGDLVIIPVTDDEVHADSHPEVDGSDVTTQIPVSAQTAPVPVTGAAPPVTGGAQTDAEPGPRRRMLKIFLGLMIAVALVALAGVAYVLFRNPTHAVPNLVGQDEAQATAQIAPYHWNVTVEHERSDEVPAAGTIVRTAPPAGVKLPEGDPFTLVVSDGPVLRTLPDFTGMSSTAAQTEILNLNLKANVSTANDETVAADNVASWSVEGQPDAKAGAQVEPDTLINLVVSDGPAPRTVPALVGLSSDDAAKALGDLVLVPMESSREFSNEVPAGVVMSQVPEAGTTVKRDSTVTFVVSKGPDLVTFPDLTSPMSYADAYTALTQAGFTVRLVLGDSQGTVSKYEIAGQPAAAGQTFARGTQVDVTAV